MNTPFTYEVSLADEVATLQMGTQLSHILAPGLLIFLQGDLGAGKTTLTRGILRGLHYEGKVKSPTYTLVEEYNFEAYTLYHFDLYRFMDPMEWEDAGFRDYLDARNIALIEWADKAAPYLATPDLSFELLILPEGRTLRLYAHTILGTSCLKRLSL